MEPDARAWAWLASWDRLEAAAELDRKYPDRDISEPMDRLFKQAEIYSSLASADPAVGALSYELLQRRREQEAATRKRMDKFMSEEM